MYGLNRIHITTTAAAVTDLPGAGEMRPFGAVSQRPQRDSPVPDFRPRVSGRPVPGGESTNTRATSRKEEEEAPRAHMYARSRSEHGCVLSLLRVARVVLSYSPPPFPRPSLKSFSSQETNLQPSTISAFLV